MQETRKKKVAKQLQRLFRPSREGTSFISTIGKQICKNTKWKSLSCIIWDATKIKWKASWNHKRDIEGGKQIIQEKTGIEFNEALVKVKELKLI